MHVQGLNHYTIKCRADDLEALREFYVSVVGLTEGARPDFPFDGHWLYAAGEPIVHLAALLVSPADPNTGALDHIAFTGADLDAAKRELRERSLPFDEAPVPGFPLHQIFIKDPTGLKVEVTFRIAMKAQP